MAKKNIGVVFGGRSVEHEVSVITGLQVVENLDGSKYNVIPIFISKEGDWYTGNELLDIKNYKNMDKLIGLLKKVYIPPVPSLGQLHFVDNHGGFLKRKLEPISMDVLIPALHGTNGEDGAFQGLIKMAGIPFAGCGVMASAVGMDKIIMKDIFKANNLPTVNYTWFLRKEYDSNSDAVIQRIEEKLKYPLYIKPANLGSSIGISRANNQEHLRTAIDIAGKYDRKIIVEESIESLIEINCSVLGTDHEVRASVCEQPVSWESFLSFDDKYMRSGGKGMKSASRRIPAPIAPEKSDQVQNLAMKAFQVLDCSGVARIDFLMDTTTNEIYVNEINTIPGSLSFYLWEASGMSFRHLLDSLIEIAVRNHQDHKDCFYSFDNELLQKASSQGAKGMKS